MPLPLGQEAERSEVGGGRHVLPARRAGRSSPAARRRRNPRGAGTGRPPAGGPSVGHRGLPGGGHPGHAPKTAGHPTPQQAATTTAPPHGTPPPPTPQNQTGAAAARAAPPTGGAIQIVAPATQSYPRLRGRVAGDTGGGVGGKHHAGQEAHWPGTPKHHASEDATKGGTPPPPIVYEAPYSRGGAGGVIASQDMNT